MGKDPAASSVDDNSAPSSVKDKRLQWRQRQRQRQQQDAEDDAAKTAALFPQVQVTLQPTDPSTVDSSSSSNNNTNSHTIDKKTVDTVRDAGDEPPQAPLSTPPGRWRFMKNRQSRIPSAAPSRGQSAKPEHPTSKISMLAPGAVTVPGAVAVREGTGEPPVAHRRLKKSFNSDDKNAEAPTLRPEPSSRTSNVTVPGAVSVQDGELPLAHRRLKKSSTISTPGHGKSHLSSQPPAVVPGAIDVQERRGEQMQKGRFFSRRPLISSRSAPAAGHKRTQPSPQPEPAVPGAISMAEGKTEHLKKGRLVSSQPSTAQRQSVVVYDYFDEEVLQSQDLKSKELMFAESHHTFNDQRVKKEEYERSCWSQNKCLIGILVLVLVGIGVGVGVGVPLNSGGGSAQPFDASPTPSPTFTPVPTASDTAEYVFSFLRGKSLNPNALDDTTSPEHRAATWIAEDPNFFILTDERLIVRYALAALYYSTGGGNWTKDNNWLDHGAHECHWTQDVGGSRCKDNVLWLMKLEDYGLSGTLPPDVGLLTNIEGLELTTNQIGGTLPSELALLTRLQGLLIPNNALTGTIPEEFSIFTLTYLHLGNNALTGTLPTELGSMPELAVLHLGRNSLTGTIPTEMGQLTNMEELGMESCMLESTIPSQIGMMSQLTSLRLNDNRLTGMIPEEILSLSNLQVFEYGGNFLET